jgi:transcriptional regulator with XRE-family HTH domain
VSSEIQHSLPRQVFARRVKEARKRRGWTQQQLVDRLVEIGYVDDHGGPRLGRLAIVKVEDASSSNTRSNASLEDVLALAAALDCSPMHLLVPREPEAQVRVSRALVTPAAALARWIAGYAEPLRILLGAAVKNADDVAAFLSQMPRWEVEAQLERAGLTPHQIEDTRSALDTGVIPWPADAFPQFDKEEGGNDG